jgi:hypothetical protein
MKWLFFAYGLFAVATVLRYLPVGGWGLALRLGNAESGMPFSQIAYYLLLTVGSIIILAQVIGHIIKMIAAAHAHK